MHTPGPWVVYRPQTYAYIRSDAPETRGHYVMDHNTARGGYVIHDADAALISAAPDLLAAAKAALDWIAERAIGEPRPDGPVEFAGMCSRAIAKAEGRE